MTGRFRFAGFFVAAACLHAGVLAFAGKAFQARAEFAVAPGETVELTLMQSATVIDTPVVAEPPAITEPEPPPPVEPEPQPEPEPPPPPEPEEMIEPAAESQPTPRPKPPTTARPAARTAAPATRSASASENAIGGPNSGARVLARPNYLSNPPPAYPAASRQAREQGVVLLSVFVTQEGRAGSVRLLRSSGFPRLDDSARNAVSRWRFSPSRVGSVAVSSEVEVPVRFHLK